MSLRRGLPCQLYVMVADPSEGHFRYFKIGISQSLEERVFGVQTGCPLPITHVMRVQIASKEAAGAAEADLHRLLVSFKTSGEWFRFDLASPVDRKAFKLATHAVLDPVLGCGWKWSITGMDKILDERSQRAALAPKAATGRALVAHAIRMKSRMAMW